MAFRRVLRARRSRRLAYRNGCLESEYNRYLSIVSDPKNEYVIHMNTNTETRKTRSNFNRRGWAASLACTALISTATFAQHAPESSSVHGNADHTCQPVIPDSSLFEFSRSGHSDCGDRNIIDILWVYTPAALERIGSESFLEVLCQINVGDANTTFANSQLPFSVRTVGIIPTDYDESGDHLGLLQGQTDGVMDEVHGIRDSVAADIVVLINDAGFCGVAYLAPNNEAFGFQKVTASCFATTNAFRHELGHNLGSRHFVDDPGGFFSYSSGHVLSFDDGPSLGTAMGGNAIAHFSNPEVDYNGVPTGVPLGTPGAVDNWLTFMQTVPMVAKFRCSGDCNGNGIDDAVEISTGVAPDCDENGVPDECQVDLNMNGIIDACEPFPVAIHVPSDLPTIQHAVALAESGVHEVVVGAGTWYGSIDTLGKAITVRSEFGPEATILDALGDGRVVTVRSGEGASTVIDGFTITGGAGIEGAGIYIENSSPELRNCIVTGNTADYAGGGMRVTNGDPLVFNCRFVGNTATWGGGVSTFGGDPVFDTCVFSDNTARSDGGGGGVVSWTSNSSFSACTFKDNTSNSIGGALYIVDGGGVNAPVISSSLFCQNTISHINQSQWIDGGNNDFLEDCPCRADFSGDGVLDFFDISEFLTAFGNLDPLADFSGDGEWDFFDLSAFLVAYASGCP